MANKYFAPARIRTEFRLQAVRLCGCGELLDFTALVSSTAFWRADAFAGRSRESSLRGRRAGAVEVCARSLGHQLTRVPDAADPPVRFERRRSVRAILPRAAHLSIVLFLVPRCFQWVKCSGVGSVVAHVT